MTLVVGLTNTRTVVSGYVSTVDRWERFDADWRLLLAKENVPYFHMNEFAGSRKVYKDWKGNEVRRARFLSQLAEIISAHALRSFSAILFNRQFYELNERYELRERVGNPYTFCARTCAAKAREWMQRDGYNNRPIEYVFEAGDRGKGLLRTIFKRDLLPEPIFRPKLPQPGYDQRGILTPLQAADFVAWEHQKSVRQIVEKRLTRLRKSLEALRNIEKDWGIYTPKKLLQFCETTGIPKRS